MLALENQLPGHENFPRGYLQGSDIANESRATLGVLSDIRTFVGMRRELAQRGPEGEPRFLTPAPGFVWDSPALDELLDDLSGLGLLGKRDDDEPPNAFVPIHVVEEVTPIVRGYIEHVRTIALKREPKLVLYLKVKGFPDTVLHGERHGVVGWHYHYCDKHGRRSDTLLSFDTRQPLKKDEKGNVVPLRLNAPLFWERHGVQKAKLKARAEQWGADKRSSVFEAAQPDLDKQKPADFRRPADDARAVWPQNAVLSLPPAKSR
ncbi:hypothetical protein [Bradyrhizobium sp.]|uniref:hypothetical protein n=1 Tax=Bradyrhizobium sp. TaxID=376 RepID=UPI002C7D2266|nr:hypothetical protein [Bradyrhizobium sp.]HMM87989.1 hypothetical protein [Bradyrhizobium sp.]